MAKSVNRAGTKSVAVNKNARRNYEILEVYEAGISLMGSEVKSIRNGHVSFKDGYVRVAGGQAMLIGVHIAPYENAVYTGHEPERERRLLLHSREIEALEAKVDQKGLSVIPIRLYFRNGKLKVEIGLGRGKKNFDRRDDIKRRDIARDTARELARFK
ncbi:SsrA-binding protein SmpB [Desulfobaculum bizertense]|uniref:SsrA-binding protein n=1 Tax=Desulfobaculum bizertense DSM 18034 TaxID=1121442 RepID=A0A1T4VI32_9BACT|nr:SsrA-binding protein SmpB [Desulfobaculum bizertense]UIJ37884.1 SsrA-binding protein SmpB [Desulfobaculum bizertense]SKA64585.1 SsrA-binding protein [Desulfobaculum bizertense DSM 18034]